MPDIEQTLSDMNNPIDNDDIHHNPEMEHFSNLNNILHSLVNFIRPETFIARDELETYNELKEKFLRESTKKQPKTPLEIADIQSIRTTSSIYRFLGHHHKPNTTIINKKQKSTTSVSREELLRRLHEKMPHRQQQEENGIDHTTKRKRIKEKSKEREKKPRTTSTEWSSKPTKTSTISTSSSLKTSTIPNQITFGRFEFNTDDSNKNNSKKKIKGKQKQLINTLKKVEEEQNELNRLHEENPEEEKAIRHSQHWKSALAKAKGEKVRDNIQLLRKSIKKQQQRRTQSAKKWQKNKSETEKRMKEKQDKRNVNLQKRKDTKKAKIKKRLIKKGRLIS